jgi:hypothetical protein
VGEERFSVDPAGDSDRFWEKPVLCLGFGAPAAMTGVDEMGAGRSSLGSSHSARCRSGGGTENPSASRIVD